MNTSRIFLRGIFVFSLLLIFINAGCASSPAPTSSGAVDAGDSGEETQQPVSPTFMPFPTEGISTPQATQVSPLPSIKETRRLTLEFPSKMRAGMEGDVVRLTLEVDDLGNITPTAKVDGNVVVGETIQIPDLYETHNVTAEAELDMAGMNVQPPDATYEPLKRGQSVTFYWSIRPQETGKYRGTVWLHLNFENRSTGEKERAAISAQVIDIEAVDFFGMSFSVARTSGLVGSFISGVVGFPFLEDIVKFIFKRKRKEK